MTWNFKSGEESAYDDKNALEKWASNMISAKTACSRIRKNNGWQYLTEEEFVQMAHSLGYYRYDKLAEKEAKEEE